MKHTKEAKYKMSIKSKKQVKEQYLKYIEQWKLGLKTGLRGTSAISAHIRRYIFEKYQSKCSRCGWKEINKFTNKIPLEIDHMDGNYLNMKEENLILLCPNCHSLTENFKSRNKGKGRPRKYIKLGEMTESGLR